jgi:phosphoribosylanthranilate isomerase
MAVELGAWALGMIFYEGSPRRCSLTQARLIVAGLHRKVGLCGVFVNAPLQQVVATSEELGLSMVQLHGDEGPSFCAEVMRRSGAQVIKAVQVSGAGDVRGVERFHVDFHLLDARAGTPGREGLRGGTGEAFDWTLLDARKARVPLILSGGLDAGNLAEAITAARPYAVDTASGTESTPGRKDPRKLKAFVETVKRACEDRGRSKLAQSAPRGLARDPEAAAGVRPTRSSTAGTPA